MSLKIIIVFCWVLMVFLPIALASPPAVSCVGCDDGKTGEITTDGTNSWQTFYAKEGSRIALQGNSGFWEDDSGRKISDGSSLEFSVKDSTECVLRSSNGDFHVTINLVSLSSCVPEWQSEIKINGDEYNKGDTRETAAGEELGFSVRIGSGCKDYRVEWSANPPSAIAFVNPWSLSTKGYVAKDYSGKNPVVKNVLTSENGERRREKTVNLIVKKNSAPAIKVRVGSSIASYTSFEVSFEGSTTGRSGDEDGDYIAEIEAWLKDTNGKSVGHSRRTMDRKKKLSALSLTPGSVGQYTLTATVTDRYGATDTNSVTILVTEKGDSGRDKPLLRVMEPINCVAGEFCDLSVRSADKDIFTEYFYQGKKMVKPFKFSPGDHEVLIKAYRLDGNGRRKNEITKTVYVHVTADSNTSAIAEPANVAPIAREDPTETQKSPLDGILAIIALPIAVWRARRKIMKS
ncbi:MAG: hypothetical protein YFSK_4370 [Candidatus Yanofskyibacterium parasiticum]|nr:MAG: hypothetical protein YFSK_4370 [Candidatus Yanofskybacteria bacterium]